MAQNLTPKTFLEHWDLLLLLVGFPTLIGIALTYPTDAQLFPLLFLTVGVVAVTLELFVRLAPSKYSDLLRSFTTGLADEMPVDELSDSPEMDILSKERVDPSTLTMAIGTIVGFAILVYLVGFLPAIPVYIVATFWLLGPRDPVKTTLTVAFALLIVYFFHVRIVGMPTGGVLL